MTDHQLVSDTDLSALESPTGRLPDRRERRKAETRRRLIAAARRLFVEHGYDATRPQDIARAADVAAGTFYLHFDDKRAAFQAFTEQAAAELERAVGERATRLRGLGPRLRVSIEVLCEYSEANPGVLRAAFVDEGGIAAGESPGRCLRERLAERLGLELRRGVLRGELRDDYDVPLVASAVVGLIQHALTHGAHDGIDREGVIENVTRFCTRALEIPG